MKLLFLGHNCWTKNVEKPIKGSKDLDYRLLSTKNLRQKISSWCWHLGPGDLSKKYINLFPLWCHPQTQSKNFQFLKSKLKDFPHFQRVWTALQLKQLASYGDDTRKVTQIASTNISYTNTKHAN